MLTKVHLVKAMVFPVVMYGCETWTVKKAECQRIDAFELWCWRRLLRWGHKESDTAEQLTHRQQHHNSCLRSLQQMPLIRRPVWSSPTPQFKSINSLVLSLLHSPSLTSTHDHRKNMPERRSSSSAPRRDSAEPRPRGCSGLGEPRPALPSF